MPFARALGFQGFPGRRFFLLACGLSGVLNGLWVSEGLALGLGAMEVKSSFGEKFDAQIELKADPGAPVSVTIGSPLDYQRMGLSRPSVVDDLIIPGTLEVQEGRKVVRVISPVPLFYPSFNLVLRVEQGGDTLLENYLITVDFRQSVSLRIKAEKSQDKKPEPPSPPLEAGEPQVSAESPAPSEPAASPEPGEEASPADQPVRKGREPVVVAVHPAPLVVRESPPRQPVETEPLPTPEPVPMEEPPPPVTVPAAPAVPEKTPVPPVPAPGAVARKPAPSRAPSPPAETSKPPKASSSSKPPLVLSRETYGPLKFGESLASIVSELNIEDYDPRSVAVALWMDNREKFIKGNIHGLESGVELNLSSLGGRLQEVSPTRARWLIQNHWQEWQLINDRLKLASQIDLDPALARIFMPPAQQDLQDRLHALVEAWRSSWEKGALEDHLALFARQVPKGLQGPGFEYWKRFKTMMFRRHRRVAIRLSPPLMIRLPDRVVVSFDQWFDSNRMRSYGTKTLELIQEGDAWKVLNERFAVKKFFNKVRATGGTESGPTEADFTLPESLTFPLVVHAATRMDLKGAVAVLNDIQVEGYDAYLAPLYVTPSKKIYRILVGRFSDWDQAESLTRALRRLDAARFAAPKRFPYALKLGEYLEIQKAREAAAVLREKGVSTYLLVAGGGNFPNPVIRLLSGAFLFKENAERYREELSERRIPSEVVTP